MANRGAPIILLLLLSLSLQAQGGSGSKQSSRRPSASASAEEYVPVKSVVYRPSSSEPPAATTAVSYEPFELCQGCRCCSSSNTSSCVDTSCCYAIDCDLPSKPFGTCAFTPHTCGCGTVNCTQSS
ncbi:unnamed protein product [Miscanthus lutarioriparius]|uniref:DUF7866 domain-containing protein n=1 Tax=Miscanthus lutarioriparius TaxID=422564 RepID=A0A811RFC3_9POAL|nr:unnamed protein product [Miscanthus lutarioriparius]